MKKCPFCNAVLTDEANFCLYCMTSLDRKQKTTVIEIKKRKALPIILIFTVILLISVFSFIIITDDNKENTDTPKQTSSEKEDSRNDRAVYPEVSYIYRAAVIGDDYSSAYLPDENDIIITGVETAEITGIYYIPDHIDGKRVLGIDPLAFSDESIRDSVIKVILADGIKNIRENAFASCINMSDIYFMGESIHITADAFSRERNGILKIHCSESCDDRNFRLYKNSAQMYDAVYEYWDGGVVS